MSYTCTLYKNSSAPNHMNKSLTSLGDAACDFKNPINVENPVIYLSGTDAYDKVNYIYIPEFGRYYFATCTGGTGATLTFECTSDPLMSFKSAILASKAVVSRNPWKFDKYIHDDKMPVESRNIRSTFKFPNTNVFDGTHNCYILTTLGG